MSFSRSSLVDAGYVGALRKLEERSPWIMITGRDSSGDFYVSFVTKEYSERVTLKSSSKQQLTLLIHLLAQHWDEMLWLPVDLGDDSPGSGGDDRNLPDN